jgi:hypothetical protein
MMKKITGISIVTGISMVTGMLALGMLQGCYPDKIDYVDEYDVAATVYDPEADFGSYNTFTVIDTIIHLTDNGKDDPNLSREHDDFILELIRQNMRDKGYTEISQPDSLDAPDLILMVQALSSEYYSYYWSGYWDWYPGWDWWYPGYPGYPGYPWYPSYPWYPGYISSYKTGTLMIEMADRLSYESRDNSVDLVWSGLIDGLLVKNSSNTRNRLETQINQLFEQSSYLHK